MGTPEPIKRRPIRFFLFQLLLPQLSPFSTHNRLGPAAISLSTIIMRLALQVLSALLCAGQAALGESPPGSSNVTYFGAPRLSLDPILPILDIGEAYIRGQTQRGDGAFAADFNQCDENRECKDKSCCNSDGRCGYRPEHCKPKAPTKCISNCDAKAVCGEFAKKDGSEKCGLNLCCSFYGW